MSGKILIVDDSPEFCTMVSMVLERAGYQPVTAYSPEEGLKLAHADKPDLMLIDYMMPGMNGRELFARLHADEKTVHIPVIMITAFSQNLAIDRSEALSAGMADFLTKPISTKALVERIGEILYFKRHSGPVRD